jgi:type IX secretion system PorP/SprF family membrane protein
MQALLKANIITSVFCLISTFLWSQDPNFSQYNNLPLYLNPSLSGSFEGSYRAILAHRNQGNALFNDPYVSLSSSFDLRLPLRFDGKILNDAAGVGVMFMQDKNPGTGWNTQNIHVSGAFHKSLDPTNNQFISAGFQMGIVQKSVGYSKLTFEDQFNGTDNYNDPTAEILPANNFAFSDLAAGVQYSFMTPNQFGGFLGGSLAHFNKPNQSFYQNNILFASLVNNRPLQMRYTLHGGFQIPITDKLQIHPRFMAQKQGSHLSGMGGFNIRTIINEINNTSLHFGTSVRPTLSKPNNPQMESFIVLLGLELNELLIGFTYDVGLTSTFNSVPGRRNALELTLTYMGRYKNDENFCPKF